MAIGTNPLQIVERQAHESKFDERGGAPVTHIIMHYSGGTDEEFVRNALCFDPALEQAGKPQLELSAHYYILKDGTIEQFVDPRLRACHAGPDSRWGDLEKMNDYAIGIEVDNRGHNRGLEEYTSAQTEAIIALTKKLCKDFRIDPKLGVLGHSDVAPLRKVDPGENFPWQALHEAGIGLMPSPVRMVKPAPDVSDVAHWQQRLRDYGYPIEVTGFMDEKTEKVVTAFSMHYLPHKVTGGREKEGGPWLLHAEFDGESLSALEDLIGQKQALQLTGDLSARKRQGCRS